MRFLQTDTARWLSGALLSVMIVTAVLVASLGRPDQVRDNPRAHLQKDGEHTDHSDLMIGEYPDGPSVTRRCLECHQDAAHDFMKTNHWTWSKESEVSWSKTPVKTGKMHGFNNYCISAVGNWASCTKCHAGYGFDSAGYDFTNQENVDCLVCHEQSGAYAKGSAGLPAEGSDLAAAAKSVALPSRRNCGVCHFKGGGGNAVKHGDLDESLYHPSRDLDVHMGGNDMQCTDCHQTEHHAIPGRATSISPTKNKQVACTDCHSDEPHARERLNHHTQRIACETCHIPTVAKKEPTKMTWDWSQAGDDAREEHPHEYLKIKGEFTYTQHLVPEYGWYNGNSRIYQKGEKVSRSMCLNHPEGSRSDATSKIHPFKIHRGKQARDAVHGYLINPQTTGAEGYWTKFDWDQALRLGAEASGLEFSGKYDFIETEMHWPLSHMVSPKEKALSCVDCHNQSGEGRLDWEALGYNGDPMYNREGD